MKQLKKLFIELENPFNNSEERLRFYKEVGKVKLSELTTGQIEKYRNFRIKYFGRN